MDTPVFKEPLLGYYPCCIGFLTALREPLGASVTLWEATAPVKLPT